MDAVGPRVLVIEPDALVGEAMLALLSGHYRIECVGSPAAALSMIRRGIYDALISEVQLPGMSVEQFWQHVHSIDPDLRLVLHTGSMPLVNGLPGPANGLGEFLRKPADSTSIRTAVARTVDATHAARRMASQLAEMDRLAAELEAARLERNLYAGILHDLNGPLTVISSLADTLMLEKNAGKVGSVDWDQSVQDLMAQANLCIDISRLSMGYARSRSAPDSCDVATVLADLDRLLHFHPACRGQTLVVHPFYLPVRVVADTTAVFRVILNLA
ncbi:MAG TPA: hypothetical protein VMF06_04520 [Candidatus Limnocylindria bacterium]|nr:hypothetical protein [Candidatus Limnocylindria bacterium]